MRELRAVPLSAAAFAPYGSVVSAGLREGTSANQGTAVRFDFCAPLTSTRPGARGNMAVFRSTKKTLPFEVKLLEQHPCSTQAFLPMICARYLIVVAPTATDGPDVGGPDVERAVAFVCQPGQGIAYNVGTWHHPIIALDDDADFVMVAYEAGTAEDCVERALPMPLRVVG